MNDFDFIFWVIGGLVGFKNVFIFCCFGIDVNFVGVVFIVCIDFVSIGYYGIVSFEILFYFYMYLFWYCMDVML